MSALYDYHLEGLGGYQEFDRYPGEETVYVDCPTCRGKGRINTSSEKNQLISLVPFSDERLKPKRTISHVIITIAAVFLLTFLITFFIYPRSPTLELDKTVPHTIEPFIVNINTSSQRVDFIFENRWDLYNPNYFSITLASFTVQVSLGSLLADIKNATHVTIPFRSHFIIHQKIHLTYKEDLAFMVNYCQDPRQWVHTSLMRFQATCITTSRDSNNTSVLESYQYVSCALPATTTVPPPTTTTTTPKTTTPASTTTPKTTTTSTTTKTPSPTTHVPSTTSEAVSTVVTTEAPTTVVVTTVAPTTSATKKPMPASTSSSSPKVISTHASKTSVAPTTPALPPSTAMASEPTVVTKSSVTST